MANSVLVPDLDTLLSLTPTLTDSVEYQDFAVHLLKSELSFIYQNVGKEYKTLADNSSRNENQDNVFLMLQSACAYEALFKSTMETVIRRTGEATAIVRTEKMAIASDSKLLVQKNEFRDNAFSSLETAINLMDNNIDDFQTYKNEVYAQNKELILYNTQSFEYHIFINNSPIVYKKLVPNIREFQKNDLKKIWGETIYNAVVAALISAPNYDGLETTVYKNLVIDYACPFLAHSVYADMLLKNLLYLDSNGAVIYKSNPSEDTAGQSFQTADRQFMVATANEHKQSATYYKYEMIQYLNANPTLFPTYTNQNTASKHKIFKGIRPL